MFCTRLDVWFVIGMVTRYQANIGLEHCTTIKNILNYLKRMRNYMFMFYSGKLIPIRCINLDF